KTSAAGGSTVMASIQTNTSTNVGVENTGLGYSALSALTTGNGNTALGTNAGSLLTTGNYNIDIGHPGLAGDSNTIRLGDSTAQTNAYIAGIFANAAILSDAAPVIIDSTGHLGTASRASLVGATGPTGPTGSQGTTGAAGPQGPTGSQGLAGATG